MWFQSPETLKIQESLRYFRLFHNGVTVSKFAKYYDKMDSTFFHFPFKFFLK